MVQCQIHVIELRVVIRKKITIPNLNYNRP
jgi:hypothetical protein